MTTLHDTRQIALTTPLGLDALLLRGFTLTEELGRPFDLELDLLSDDHSIDFDDLVGETVTVEIARGDETPRHLHGHVTTIVQSAAGGDRAEYRARVRPWL